MKINQIFVITLLPLLSICEECFAVTWMEVSDFSNNHLSPTILGNIDLGGNTVSGSIIGSEDFESDAFVLFNPNGYVIESISVQITSFRLPIYPSFDSSSFILARLPGVILVFPNDAGTVPAGNGIYHLSSDYDESGILLLDGSGQLSFSVFSDSRPELIAPGGFDYSIQIVTSVPEPSSASILGIVSIGFLVRRHRTNTL